MEILPTTTWLSLTFSSKAAVFTVTTDFQCFWCCAMKDEGSGLGENATSARNVYLSSRFFTFALAPYPVTAM